MKIIEGFVIIFIFSLILPSQFKKVSDILLHIQFLFPILPMLVLYGAQNQPRGYTYVTLFCFFIIYLIAEKFRIKAVRFGCSLSPVLYQRMLLFSGWTVIGTIILLGGMRYFNLNIWKVYEFRSIASRNLPHIVGYLSVWSAKAFFPFAFLISVFHKKIVPSGLAIVGSIMIFGLTSHKGPLFYPWVVLGLFYILNRQKIIQSLLLSYFGIITTSVMLYAYAGHIIFGMLFLRRPFFVPAILNYLHYDFFRNHMFSYWADSKITFGILDKNYSLQIPYLIGNFYYGHVEWAANTGWIGSGYANAGFLGMILCSIMLGLLLAILNAYGRIIDKKIVSAIIMSPAFAIFMSSDIFTALLSHGILISLVLFALTPSYRG